MKLAHIAIFAYNRKLHLTKTIEALLNNELINESSVTIFCDGAKSESDEIKVKEVREYINTIKGFNNLEIIDQTTNIGLSKSIISGVSYILSKNESIIVIEDDIVTSRYFLTYMNKALKIYQNDETVASIHGYVYPIKYLPKLFFIRGADCWGWATWKRSWDAFEQNGDILLNKLQRNNLSISFNMYGAFNYTNMLKNQILKKNDSWAIRWHASNFIDNKLTLYPGLSLVENIGADGSGTNFNSIDNSYKTSIFDQEIIFEKIKIEESVYSKYLFIIFFYKRKVLKVFQLIFFSMRQKYINY